MTIHSDTYKFPICESQDFPPATSYTLCTFPLNWMLISMPLSQKSGSQRGSNILCLRYGSVILWPHVSSIIILSTVVIYHNQPLSFLCNFPQGDSYLRQFQDILFTEWLEWMLERLKRFFLTYSLEADSILQKRH